MHDKKKDIKVLQEISSKWLVFFDSISESRI